MLDRLPEPSPLADPLPGLVEAGDRESYAQEHGLDYRTAEETVRVEIELTDDGTAPDEYLVEVQSEYAGRILATVAVNDLVDLALHDDVRIVRPPSGPQTHSPG